MTLNRRMLPLSPHLFPPSPLPPSLFHHPSLPRSPSLACTRLLSHTLSHSLSESARSSLFLTLSFFLTLTFSHSLSHSLFLPQSRLDVHCSTILSGVREASIAEGGGRGGRRAQGGSEQGGVGRAAESFVTVERHGQMALDCRIWWDRIPL